MVNLLRERRHTAGLTQQALADLAGASRSMVRLLEGGYEPPRRSAVRERLERVLSELEAARADQPALTRTGDGLEPQAFSKRDRASTPVAPPAEIRP